MLRQASCSSLAMVSMQCYSSGSRESLNNQWELPLFVIGMTYCSVYYEYSWPSYFINMCVDGCSQKKGMVCVFWFLYLWCWNLHWGWLTGLIAVLTVVFKVAEFLLLVMKPLWLFDCLLCSICCKCHKLPVVNLPFFSQSPSFTPCPCEVVCSQAPW